MNGDRVGWGRGGMEGGTPIEGVNSEGKCRKSGEEGTTGRQTLGCAVGSRRAWSRAQIGKWGGEISRDNRKNMEERIWFRTWGEGGGCTCRSQAILLLPNHSVNIVHMIVNLSIHGLLTSTVGEAFLWI